MALLYILDRDNENKDSTISTRYCYKRGDIVEVVDDCPVVQPPAEPFIIIKVLGVTRDQIVNWIDEHTLLGATALRRRFALDYARLTPAQRQYMLEHRYIEVTVAQLRPFILDKSTGQYEG